MLHFDLKNNPPTTEQIKRERSKYTIKHVYLTGLTSLFVLIIIVIAVLSIFKLIHSDEFGISDAVTAVILVSIFSVAGVGFCISAINKYDELVFCGVFGGLSIIFISYNFFTTEWHTFRLIIGICGALLSLYLANTFFIWKEYFLSQIDSLAFLSDTDRARCPQILDFCRQYDLCESYRLAVVKQNRSLTVGEADMIEKWSDEADTRRVAEIERQEHDRACQLLQSSDAG
jgi:hypothetical protein